MRLQIIYPEKAFEPSTSNYHNGWLDEIDGMRQVGLDVAMTPSPDAEHLLLRTFTINDEAEFPKDKRYISKWSDYRATQEMTQCLPLIEDITIPTFLCDRLDEETVSEIKRRGWGHAFVRSNVKSLKYMFPESGTEEELPVWPEVSMKRLAEVYNKYSSQMEPPYVIRKFMSSEIMRQEDRYWVLNGHVYHRTGVVPPVVTEAAERLSSLDAPYYTIDATPNIIIEVNPGASSDAYPENVPQPFAEWIKKEFSK